MNTFYNKTFSFIQIRNQPVLQRIMNVVIIRKIIFYFLEILLCLPFLPFSCQTAEELQKIADKWNRLK